MSTLERPVTRIAIAGVSHWHLSLFLPTLLEMDDVDVVGVSDQLESTAADVGRRLGVPSFGSYSRMCDSTSPDFVVAFDEHANMAELGNYLATNRIPFIMEKPCGTNLAEVTNLAQACEANGVYAAVPFVWRISELLSLMRSRFDDADIDYLMLRWIAGEPQRYVDSGCEWMLDRSRAGGGCTINLSVHLLDLANVLLGPSVAVEGASVSNAGFGLDVEDWSQISLRAGERRCTVETGYLVPAAHSTFDLHFSVSARSHYLTADGSDTVTMIDRSGVREQTTAATTNVPHYPLFIRESLARWREGRPPIAGMPDMVAVMQLVEAAYEKAGFRQRPAESTDGKV